MLRFFFDAGVGRLAEAALTASGLDVRSVLDVDPSMEDVSVLALAASEGRILVTMDRDFGQLAFELGAHHAGILLLRLDRATGPEKAETLKSIVASEGERLRGRFTVYQGGKLRSRAPADGA